MRHLGVSYKTAWLMKLKLLQVMTERESSRVLDGRVEIDNTYLGGERPGKRGRCSENKRRFDLGIILKRLVRAAATTIPCPEITIRAAGACN
ncbi:MAG: hypothetical protein DID90_2727553219 [Candidatus Nitrotoga sp. LAW]|nr:MAG: hypothetical protein DID90_2727553219 [Candidatus Nitrotoga sp. LAW]